MENKGIPNEDKMFHLPIEMVVYVPSTQDVDKVISVDEMTARVDEVKKYLAGLFGGYTSSEKLGGYVATNSELVNEQIVQVVAFSTKEAFETNKEKVINKLSEWAKQWGQEAIGFEYEGDLFYVPQKFGMGGFVLGAIAGVVGTLYYQKRNKKGAKKGSKKYFEGGDIEGYDTYVVEFKKSGQTRRVGVVAHNEKEAVAKAKKMISGKGYTVGNVRRFAEGGGVSLPDWVNTEDMPQSVINALLKREKISYDLFNKSFYETSPEENDKVIDTMKYEDFNLLDKYFRGELEDEQYAKGGGVGKNKLNALQKRVYETIKNRPTKTMSTYNLDNEVRKALEDLYYMDLIHRDYINGTQEAKYTLKYAEGGGVGSSKKEFTYSVVIRPNSQQYDGVQFKSITGSKEVVLADRENFSKDFEFDKDYGVFQELLKTYSKNCFVDLMVYGTTDTLFPKHFNFDLSNSIDAEINGILENIYYIELTNKDKTSIYIYDANEITTDPKKGVEKIKQKLRPEDSYDVTIKTIRMKDDEVIDTEKVVKKDKLPRIKIGYDNVKKVAIIEEEDGSRFQIKYKDIIAFIREELDTPEVIKSRMSIIDNVKIKEEIKDKLAKNIPIAIKLDYYLKYKMNYKNGNYETDLFFPKKREGGSINNFTDYYLVVNLDERGQYSADVKNPNDEIVFSISSAEEMNDLIADGFLKYQADEDLDRLTQYLMSQGIIPNYSQIYSEEEFDEKVREYGEGGGIEKEFLEFTIPTWALPSLINADDSGLEDEDIEKLNKFIDRIHERYGNANFMLGDKSEETEFSWRNDIDGTLGGDVTTLYLMPTKEYAKGGNTQRTKYAVSVDKRYKSSKPSGRRVSSKYSTITMADGTTFRRRNANQTGDVKGGRTYNEKRPNRTDRKGTQVPPKSKMDKKVSSVKQKSVIAPKPKTIQRSKPAQTKTVSSKLKFLGVEFNKYDYSIGGL